MSNLGIAGYIIHPHNTRVLPAVHQLPEVVDALAMRFRGEEEDDPYPWVSVCVCLYVCL